MSYILEAENINLTYEIKSSLSLKKLFTRSAQNRSSSYVHAVKDLSFQLERGQNLGIVGSNGSGKSTLMRMISQTYLPDSGRFIINADSVSFLALGTGFMPDLTGWDNIYLNALLLGISKKKLDDGFAQSIADYSEIGEFVNYSMDTYSSGMRSRLMFAIAACIEPDLLLIDEIFSVGDAHFVEKSQKRVREMIKSDSSVIIVSHDSKAILDYCDKVMWLEKGEKKMFGEPKEVMDAYHDFLHIEKHH